MMKRCNALNYKIVKKATKCPKKEIYAKQGRGCKQQQDG